MTGSMNVIHEWFAAKALPHWAAAELRHFELESPQINSTKLARFDQSLHNS
jgi:hypothetical protein